MLLMSIDDITCAKAKKRRTKKRKKIYTFDVYKTANDDLSQSTMSETKTTSEINDETQLPPPSYNSVILKIAENSSNSSVAYTAPPNYGDIDPTSVVYINNYPGPPLVDGTVQIVTYPQANIIEQSTVSTVANQRIRRFLFYNGVVTTLLGIAAIVLQIILITSASTVYYYLGFWAGALIISLGISTFMLNNRHATANLPKLFRSFIWQGLFVGVIFILGLIIILTNPCRERLSTMTYTSCDKTNRLLNGFLLTVIGLVLLQTGVILVVIGIARRRYPTT